MQKIFVNGNWVGIHREPKALVETVRSLRRMVDMDAEVSIVRDIAEKEIRIYMMPARKSLDGPTCSWKGLSDSFDTEEEETIMIAMEPKD